MSRGRVRVGPGQGIASDWGNAVWDQSVQTFANAADRTNQYPNPTEGSMSYLEDRKLLYVYRSGAWQPVGPQGWAGMAVGAVVWGTFDFNKVVRILGGYFEASTNAASACEFDISTGTPFTCIVAVNALGSFRYGAGGGWANAFPMLNRDTTVGNATGGHVSLTYVRGDFSGIGVATVGTSWSVAFQDN